MLELDLNPQKHLRQQKRYLNASPYPHCIIDGMWPEEFLNEILQEWPSTEHGSWRNVRNDNVFRNRNAQQPTFPPSVKRAFSSLDSPKFRAQLEELTGYENLIIDPRFGAGAGMHHDLDGAYLGVHTDAQWNSPIGYRVINIFLYLNPEWKPENGGELVLWDASTKEPVTAIPPLFNRTVVMVANRKALHEVLPVSGMVRRSLALYYYVEPPPDEANKEGVIWHYLRNS